MESNRQKILELFRLHAIVNGKSREISTDPFSIHLKRNEFHENVIYLFSPNENRFNFRHGRLSTHTQADISISINLDKVNGCTNKMLNKHKVYFMLCCLLVLSAFLLSPS